MAAFGAALGIASLHAAQLARMTAEQRARHFLDQKEEVRLAKDLADREGLEGQHRERLINYAREVAA